MSSFNILFVILLYSSITCIYGKNFTCYQCYYSTEHLQEEWNKPECMDSPASPGVSVRAPCRENYYCYVQETYDIPTKQIVEFSRSCLAVGYGTICTKDTYRLICQKTCQGDLCNRNVTANLHELHFNNSNGLFNVIETCFCLLCSTFVLFLLKMN